MAYGHSSSGHVSLDGVEFKLSEVFTSKPHHSYATDFDLKDPEVLLEDLEYNFQLENKILEEIRRKREEKEEQKRLKNEQKKREKQELEEKHRLCMLEKEKEEELKKKLKEEETAKEQNISKSRKLSPSNPFYNDLTENGILKPQPASPDKGVPGPKQPSNVNIYEFETEAPDPFSDMELKTIDDIQELKDVLQIVSSNSGKQSPEEVVTSIGENNSEIIAPVNGVHNEPQNSERAKKSILIDQLTDLLTDDAEAADGVSQPTKPIPAAKPRNKKVKNIQPQYFPSQNPPGFLPPITSPPAMSARAASPRLSPANSSSFTDIYEINAGGQRRTDVSSSQTVPANSQTNVTQNVYENIPSNIPPVKPRVVVRKRNNNEDNKSPTPELNPNSYGAVKSKVLANKSASERAKFEDTINKALTSLPQLPNKTYKPLPQDVTDQQTLSEQIKPKSPHPQPLSPGLLSGLGQDERDFAKSLISMGFKEQDVIRTMQKYGTDQKDVIEHLVILQRLVDHHFEIKNIEEALDIFNGNEQEAVKYLQLERQFIDMGFSTDKIKEALLLTDRNQEKALGILMGET
uniref:Ubiquitin-associated protein 1 n=1 Tax=Phallusia mammillata TaxID=59560 RepID=A0A6F9DWS5_9ASCI|nr:ubiquitin-associated protein 1 [Phallusia mammillata]